MLDHEPENNENESTSAAGRDVNAGEQSAAAPAKRVRRRAASRPAGAPDSAIGAAVASASAELAHTGLQQDESAPAEQAPAPVKRATRKRAAKKTAAPAEQAAEPAETPAPEQPAAPAAAQSAPEAPAEQAPAASPRRTRKRAASRAAGAPENVAAPETAAPAAEPAESPVAEAPAEQVAEQAAAEEPGSKSLANAKRTRKAGAAKRAAKRAASAPESTPEPAAEAPIVVVPIPDDLDEDEAEGLAEAVEAVAEEEEQAARPAVSPFAASGATPSWSGNLFQAPVSVTPFRPASVPAQPAAAAEEPEQDEEHAEEASAGSASGGNRRRRRSRNRRGESAQPVEASAEQGEDAEDKGEDGEQPSAQHPEALDLPEETSRRRRRRRRRQTAEDLASGGAESSDDPPNTVVKVREPRQRRSAGSPDSVATGDEVMGLRGSVRLVAKQQRRREGRATRSRRTPVITEAEFLARRESVERVMVVRQTAGRTQIGVLEDGVLVEHYVNRESSVSYVGNVYLGKVQNVLPSMEAAFVDINKGRNAVLYAGEVNFDAAGLSGQPRRIESALKSGQSVLVQVTKDPIGHKGARLTSQISLPGRFLVYIPGGSMMGISRKLPDTERARLKQILKKVVPEDGGVIVRTAAEGASEQELSQDVARLVAQWEEIERKAKTASAPALLSGEPDLTVRVVRDIFNEDFSKLIVSGDTAYKTVHEYLSGVAPELAERVEHWTSETDAFSVYRIEEQLAKALDRKVWLPSGGSLVIDRTEAMVVIDVNTGKFTGQGSSSLEETVTRNNLEAAEEIVRQLRLRDLGGIVVIDFIDMVLESNRDLVLRRLLECLGRDRTKHQVAEVTSLGLVQMTRKRVGQGLLEAFSEPCEHCNGRGVIVHTEPIEHNGRKPEQQGSSKQKQQQQPHGESPAAADEAGERTEESGEGRRGRRRRKVAGRAATNEAADGAEQTQGQAGPEASPVAEAEPAEAATPDEGTEAAAAPSAEPEEAPQQAADAEPAEPLNLKAHADDPDALEDALADSGRPRRRARRAASRPAGAPSA
ncbi:ribonuclease E/G [Actinospica sp. MGRD01-02]|uniref:Ribonuclease E n=1 Tax=Actinospica acidithermotolerans TaxID=2828514 RepID=A0A941EEH5_9ACTN|nr:Rne/Rng family ribonuclease [Actinospica acidithermotolerans]MBR7830011.1 ribonuclease E/G [Actinospica acidithermotolerans]